MTFSRLVLVAIAFTIGCGVTRKGGQDTASVRGADTASVQDTAAAR